jgi:plastocyanin
VRCQSEGLPCSYLRLKALSQSGRPVPRELHMTREELGTLVGQLDRVAAHLERYRNGIDRACADGYRTRSAQVANMGFHMAKTEYMADHVFDPEKPEILLFAVEGADQLTQKDIGDCVDGRWTGDPRQQIVGAAFILSTQQFGSHPKGFAGPLDNWHVHYHVCLGTLAATSLSKADCERRGGSYLPDTGWMLHAYVVPEFDNPLGVFSVWNPSIWPKTDARTLAANAHGMMGPEMIGQGSASGHAGHETHEHAMHEGAAAATRESVIFEFKFEPVEIKAGESAVFRNGDHAFHTVTAGTPGAPAGTFDSGKLGVEQTFTTRFDKPGVYPIFCRVHPGETGRVLVN